MQRQYLSFPDLDLEGGIKALNNTIKLHVRSYFFLPDAWFLVTDIVAIIAGSYSS